MSKKKAAPRKGKGRRRRSPSGAAAPAAVSPSPPSSSAAAASAASGSPKRGRGRPTRYTEAIAQRLVMALSEGRRSLRRICEDDETLPAESTVRSWAVDASHPFAAQYTRARAIGYHMMGDDIVDIADDSTNDYMERKRDGQTEIVFDKENVLRSKLRVDSRKWMVARMLPKLYGDKLQHTGEGGDKPVQVSLSASDELLSRIARLSARRAEGGGNSGPQPK